MEILANALLVIPFLASAYYWIKGNSKLGSRILTLTLFSGALGTALKLVFRVRRDTGFDPFAFPSFHASLSWPLFFAVPNPWTGLYAIAVSAVRVLEGFHTWDQVFAGFMTALLAWLIYRELERRMGSFAERKMFHIGIALIVGYISLFLSLKKQILFAGIILAGAILVYLLRNVGPVNAVYDHYSKHGKDKGPITLAFGIFLGSLVGLAPLVAFVLGLVDGLSGILGKLRRSEGKSLAGLSGGYLGALSAFLLLQGFYDPVFLGIVCIISPLVEYFTRTEGIDDNISIALFIVGFFLALSPGF